MILKYEKADKYISALDLKEPERVYYAVPFDIGPDNNITEDSYIIVTNKKVYTVLDGNVARENVISGCKYAKNVVGVGCGMLILNIDGEDVYIASYSSKHLSRYAYIARGINILISGRTEEVISHEYEKICPKCGHVMSGGGYCTHCSKEGGFVNNFMKLAKPYKKDFTGIIILMILASVVTLLNPEVQKHLVDDVLMKNSAGRLKPALICIALMFLLSVGIVVINILKSYFSTLLGAKIAKDTRSKLFEKIQKLSLQYINNRRPGELMNRVVFDTGRIRIFMERTFCNMFTVCFIFVCDIIYMLFLNVRLALMSFIFIPIAAVLAYMFRKSIHRRFHLQWKKNDDVNSNLQDVISGMRIVKCYGRENAERKKFDKLADEFCRVQTNNEVFWAVFNPCINFIVGAGVFLVIYFGASDVIAGEMTPGELLQFTTYTQLLYQYLSWMTNMPREITDLVSALERINDVMDQNIYLDEDKGSLEPEIVGNITFKNASFGYRSYEPVLEGINMEVKKGEMIGIVGSSGAGKSTLINLLMRLYEVDDGEIYVDGNNIKDISSKSYHSQLGVVLQETFLFTGTILDNIRFAKSDASYDEVIAAAKLAYAHDFICSLPDGYNTYVGEKGFTLSGGERQRIAIARAILNDPRILILDEASASLDTESEYMIQKAIDSLTSERTTFAIAHRLSTLKNADRLMVIDRHRVAEIGTHEELMEKKGIYYGLVQAQLMMQG